MNEPPPPTRASALALCAAATACEQLAGVLGGAATRSGHHDVCSDSRRLVEGPVEGLVEELV